MTDLPVVTVPGSLFKANAHYMRRVVLYGHVPGVLSGAELKGRAAHFGAGYAKSRTEVNRLMAAHGVYSRLTLVDSRLSRVWTDAEGRRVRVVFAE